jgi:hypothetical protein
VAFAGTVVVLVHRRRKAHLKKRRARRFANGAKKEIVVLACPTFHDPLTRSLALDLERRGFIVYVTVSTTEEDSLVHSEAKPEIRPLWTDLTSTVPNPTVDIHPNLEPIKELLNRSSRSSSPGTTRSGQASSQGLSLAGLIVLPGATGYPIGPFLQLPPSGVIDTLNMRLISSILTVQQFLPLLSSSLPSSIVLAYPSIPLSLLPPLSLPSHITTSALSTFVRALRRDLPATSGSGDIHITELKLGNFDLGSTFARSTDTSANARSLGGSGSTTASQSALTHWHSSQRMVHTRAALGQISLVRGSAVREFHNAVFDALVPAPTHILFGRWHWKGVKPNEVYVGRGARLYGVIGNHVPQSWLGWMMDRPRRTKMSSSVANVRSAENAGRSEGRSPGESSWRIGSEAGSVIGGESVAWEKV